jgi:hypothetical protein
MIERFATRAIVTLHVPSLGDLGLRTGRKGIPERWLQSRESLPIQRTSIGQLPSR